MMMTITRKMTNTTTTAAATIPKNMDWLSPAIVVLVPPLRIRIDYQLCDSIIQCTTYWLVWESCSLCSF